MKDRYGGLIRIRLSSVSHLGDSEFKSNCRYTCTLSMNFDSSVIEDQGDEIKTFKRVFSVDHCNRLILRYIHSMYCGCVVRIKFTCSPEETK